MSNDQNSDALFEKIVDDEVVISYCEAKSFLQKKGIVISTITLDCKLRTTVDIVAFATHVTVNKRGIASVKYGDRDDVATNRRAVIIKNKKKASTKSFYNQVTILIKPTNSDRNYINIKVFKNGSLQMTGCKDLDDFKNVVTRLIKILKKGKTNDTGHLSFIQSPETIGIYDVKVRLINSDFRLNHKVDRKKLFHLLKKHHHENTKDTEIGFVDCKYHPTGGHSCVNIRCQYGIGGTSGPSVFVFETGAIIITGAKTLHQIIRAYKFIKKILTVYRRQIRIIALDNIRVQDEICKFFEKEREMENH